MKLILIFALFCSIFVLAQQNIDVPALKAESFSKYLGCGECIESGYTFCV